MKQTTRNKLAVILVLLMTLGLQACSIEKDTKEYTTEIEGLFLTDPFEEDNYTDTEILGWLRHGVKDPILDSNGIRAIYEYQGDKFELKYQVVASGAAKNVGFLLFLDGLPQPYWVNGEGELDYMHLFRLEEDDQEFSFSFVL